MGLLLVHNFIVSCSGHRENTASVSYTDLPDVKRFHCTIFLKSHTLLIPIDVIRSLLSFGKLSSSKYQTQIFQNYNFHLKTQWYQILSVAFLEVTGSLHSFSRQYLPNTE